jgi:hypothetical protein
VTSSNRENDALEKTLRILSFFQKTFNDIFDYSIFTKIIVKIASNIVSSIVSNIVPNIAILFIYM